MENTHLYAKFVANDKFARPNILKLKRFYELYARYAFGLSEADAYELQRVLQMITGFERGRPGPGGGAPATAFSVTAFIIAVMAAGPRRQAINTMFNYYELLQEGAETAGWGEDFQPTIPHCPLTDQRQFGPALKHVFETPVLAERVEKITLIRDWPEAMIDYRTDVGNARSRFVNEYRFRRIGAKRLTGALETIATLGGKIVHQIALDLSEVDDAEWTPDAVNTK